MKKFTKDEFENALGNITASVRYVVSEDKHQCLETNVQIKDTTRSGSPAISTCVTTLNQENLSSAGHMVEDIDSTCESSQETARYTTF